MRWLIVLAALSLAPVLAATPAEKGREIAVEMDRRDSGWRDEQAALTMILRDREGRESRRELRIRSLEVETDGDKMLTVFDRPRDIKGTAFLSFTHATRADDQWLYLPALKRVKRIASVNKSGPFMGSEFAYEDLTSLEVEKYTHRWLRNERIRGRDAFVVERVPVYEHSGYSRQVVWIDRRIYRPLEVEYYDRKNELFKTLVIEGYSRYLERYWRPARMVMVNHRTGKSTVLEWSDFRFHTGLGERDFSRAALKRVR